MNNHARLEKILQNKVKQKEHRKRKRQKISGKSVFKLARIIKAKNR